MAAVMRSVLFNLLMIRCAYSVFVRPASWPWSQGTNATESPKTQAPAGIASYTSMNLRPLVIVSQEQSGSGFLCSMLDSHPAIVCLPPNGAASGSIEDRLQQEAYRVLHSGQLSAAPKWMGIVVETSELDSIPGGLQHQTATFIFHWRRNTLRQVIAHDALEQTHQTSYPMSPSTRAYRPMIPVDSVDMLDCAISQLLAEHSTLYNEALKSGVHVCPISHYEDYILPQALAEAETHLFSCLQVPGAVLTANTFEVHEKLDILATPDNWKEVGVAIKLSRYSYMAEDQGDAVEVHNALKASDSYDTSPPPPHGCAWEGANPM